MRYTLLTVFIVIASDLFAQNLMRCNDSVSFFVNYKNDYSCSIRLKGKITKTENSRVINYNDCALQTLFVDKQDYRSDKSGDIPVLTNYMISETQYFTNVYNAKLNLAMIPVQVNQDKKAVIWYFDIPASFQKNIPGDETPAIRQVSISIIIDKFIYSIGTTQFKNQNFNDLQVMLTNLIKTLKLQKGNIELNDLCSDI